MFGENGSKTVRKESRCLERMGVERLGKRADVWRVERMGVERLGKRADVWREWE